MHISAKIVILKAITYDVKFAAKGGFYLLWVKTCCMHHWYRNMQSLRSLPLKKKVGRRGLPEPIPDGKPDASVTTL